MENTIQFSNVIIACLYPMALAAFLFFQHRMQKKNRQKMDQIMAARNNQFSKANDIHIEAMRTLLKIKKDNQ